MNKKKKKRLEEKGWKVGTVNEFLDHVNGKGDQAIIKKGPYKGKKIVCASTEGVDSLRHVAVMFIKRIFKLEPDAYFITDEARLRDFTDFGSGDVTPILRKIKRIYGLDVSDIANGNLLEIFRRIEQKKPRISMKDFDALLKQVRRQAKQAGLKRSDITEAIQNVRLLGRIPPQDSDKNIDDAAYLEKRAAKGSRRRFERARKKIRDVKPAPEDEL
jgi:hypothetical protein